MLIEYNRSTYKNMNNNTKRNILLITIKTVVMGGLMFLFYYYADKIELKKALLKAATFGLLVGMVSTWGENWWINKNNKKKTDS